MALGLLKIFFEVHSGLLREGPDDNESTQKAHQMLRDLLEKSRILDVGCGPGMQTIQLAKLSKGRIDALDCFPQFLEQIQRKAEQGNDSQYINTVNGDMFKLNYENHTFDLIWSEGAVYIIGFEKGLREWKRLLTSKGYLVVSHIVWIKPNPPQELKAYWEQNYPGITIIEANLETVKKVGYEIVGYFVLPAQSLWENYYCPIEAKLDPLMSKYYDDPEALTYLASEKLELEMFRRFSDYYSYIFYILHVSN